MDPSLTEPQVDDVDLPGSETSNETDNLLTDREQSKTVVAKKTSLPHRASNPLNILGYSTIPKQETASSKGSHHQRTTFFCSKQPEQEQTIHSSPQQMFLLPQPKMSFHRRMSSCTKK